ncbi:helix-turn-helix domain-containing protein [Halorussus gelatinilyticus]|uniref:Helix-turn-helix domain-containing protein n=1 Tax=Halorussus gelatinilyticus TaxID=2937524 RepID=A0A8U0IQA1_9EURY|nr:helix-turn-helix domain-containing protein [Halorussus gelatinilyticus]UPW02189.1 helix-turn-helix domain-containing protein [Halorussus gelatinilyticus]
MAEDTTGGLRLTLDIWHPDCWTLEVTDRVAGGLLGHGVHRIDGMANGRFTAYGDSTDEVDELVEAVRDSELTDSTWETADPHADADTQVPGSASRGIVVRYDMEKSINDALVSRGFIPDEPVRMYDGREYWTVIVNESRNGVHERIDAVREEMDADVAVELITAPSAGSGMFRTDALSARQREVFELARQEGYYTWPREVSATELADDLGVSKATLLEHLRKAEVKLLGEV